MTRRQPAAPPRRSPSSTSRARPHAASAAVLATLVVALAAVDAAFGPGFVSDDGSLAGAELMAWSDVLAEAGDER